MGEGLYTEGLGLAYIRRGWGGLIDGSGVSYMEAVGVGSFFGRDYIRRGWGGLIFGEGLYTEWGGGGLIFGESVYTE